jgi:hypothetical protein
LKSPRQLVFGQYVGEIDRPGTLTERVDGREVLAAATLLVIIVGADRLGMSVAGVNLRLELVTGGLLALWFFVRTRGAVVQRLGVVEYALLGWLAVNVISSLLFSPSPPDSLKNAASIAGVLTIYLLWLMLFNSAQAVTWAAVTWVAVGAVVSLVGLLWAFLYTFFGWTSGIGLERAYRDGNFILTPRVQSTMWEPNIFGSYSVTVGVLALVLSLSPEFGSPTRQRWLRFAVGCAFCGIMLSMTRTVWVLGPLLLIVLVLLSLRLKLATMGQALKGMLLPAAVGIAVGLAVGNFLMPTLTWKRDYPWDLTYQQAEQAVPYLIRGITPPPEIENPQGSTGATRTPTPVGPTPTSEPVGSGSTIVDKVLEAMSPSSAPSVQGRLIIFTQAIDGWKQKPLLGWGTGAYPLVYPPDLNGYWIANLELHILFDTGIVGLFLFGIAVVATARRGWRGLRGSGPGWSTVRLVLLGLLLSAAGLFLAYQVTDATWMGFTWALLALLMMAARFAAQTSATGQTEATSRVGSHPE